MRDYYLAEEKRVLCVSFLGLKFNFLKSFFFEAIVQAQFGAWGEIFARGGGAVFLQV